MGKSHPLPSLLTELEDLDRHLMSMDGSEDWSAGVGHRMKLLQAVFAHPDIARCAANEPQCFVAIRERQQQLVTFFQARRTQVSQQLGQLTQGRKAVQAYLSR